MVMLRTISLLALVLFPGSLPAQQALPEYRQWRSACVKLPTNRELMKEAKELPEKEKLPLPKFADFEKALDGYLTVTRKGPLADAANWVGPQPEPKTFFDETRSWYGDERIPFEPFAAKLVLPDNAEAIVMGDLHGDVLSLIKTLDDLNDRGYLEGFKLRKPNYYFLFLGDYTDRGKYGVEVLYTLFRLKMANPDQVHFARGNHEDFTLAARYGFLDELKGKYGQEANITKVMRAYDRMPVVLYVGTATDFLQMNHGGMEPGYNPRGLLAATGAVRYQLLGKLQQKAYNAGHPGWLGSDPDVLAVAERHLRDFIPESPTNPRTIGFMWNDFTVFADEPSLGFERSLVFGLKSTHSILSSASTDKVRVRGVFRAHQHLAGPNAIMNRLVASDGAFRHWPEKETLADREKSVREIRLAMRPEETRAIPDGSVWTFNVAPDSVYGTGCGFDFATVGILKMAPEFKNWRLTVLRISVF